MTEDITDFKLEDVLVRLIQEDHESVQKVVKGDYEIQEEVNLSEPFRVSFSKRNYKTKIVYFDFNSDSMKLWLFDDVFSPFNSLDMTMVPITPVNEKASLKIDIARFECRNGEAWLDYDFVLKKREETNAMKTNFTGKFKFKDEFGNILSKIKFKEGQLNGKCKWFFPNGKKRLTGYFENGLKNGKFIEKNIDGELVFIKEYKGVNWF